VPTPTLAIETSRTRERVRLMLAGEVDLSTRDALINATIRALADPVARLELDVSGVRFCDSSGISGFLAVRRIAAEHDTELLLTNASPQLEQLLVVTGLHDALTTPRTMPDDPRSDLPAPTTSAPTRWWRRRPWSA
jgi:anti-sigma B factor antagonist